MSIDVEKLKEKYHGLNAEIDNFHKAHNELNDYFVSIVTKKKLTDKDMFSQSVINRTNQCLVAANYCLINDLPFPLLNIIRQLIEIYATNEYIITDKQNFEKAFWGKKDHPKPNLKLPNIKTIVENYLEKKEPIIVKVYNEYSELSHPNSRSVFSVFEGEKKKDNGYGYSMTNCDRIIEQKEAYHILRNIAGLANRIFLSIKEINPLPRYVTFEEFGKTKSRIKQKSKKKPSQARTSRFASNVQGRLVPVS